MTVSIEGAAYRKAQIVQKTRRKKKRQLECKLVCYTRGAEQTRTRRAKTDDGPKMWST